MKKNKSKKVNLETVMLVGLNAFAIGMFLQKVLIYGIGWMSTIGYLKQEEEKMNDNDKKPNGISWFALGFSIASLIAVLIK